ncbi:MAG: 2-oxo acid dehydrogenase subunit E2 [Proteiniphilum sp.]|nr:2-oxo acid dehydrogenase subunit E2 [Proteiniphilum sp.]
MRYTFNFPDLGEGLEEGTILEWYVKEGDSVKVGDSIVQMETDKVVADIPSPKSGIIAARYGNVGDVIHVGAPLVEIEQESTGNGQDVTEEKPATQPISEPEEGAAVVGTMELAGKDGVLAASNEGSSETGSVEGESRKVLATPVARALAKEMGIDIRDVTGSDPSGRVKKEDILNFRYKAETATGKVEATGPATGDVTYLPLTQIRKTIARNMLHSKHNAAHMSVFEEVEITGLMQLIAKFKLKYADREVKLTYLPFIVKAVAQALKHHPQLNSQIDSENNRMIVHNRYNIAIAVDAPDGLVVPVIRDADRLSIFQIAEQIGELASKARARKLTLEDMKEGSFSITSFGSIGGIFATPVINYPQAGILGIGRIMRTPIVRDDEIVIGNIMPLSLTVDHRIVDGGETTRFLKRVMEYLADPITLIMEE